MLPFDASDSRNRVAFENDVASKMRAGERGNTTFMRSKNDKGDEEEVYISYAPVTARTLSAVNASDFSQGVSFSTQLVYSVGFGITVEGLELPFQRVEDQVTKEISRANYISLALIIAGFLFVVKLVWTM